MSYSFETAVVTGASRGFGRAVAEGLLAADTDVVGIARGEAELLAVREELGERFTPVVADAADGGVAAEVLRTYQPDLLVLNAGATPRMAPVQEQDWESFSRNWNADTRHVFEWSKAALRAPLASGSVVLSISSGAAIGGSPLSGGYASAKAAIRFLRGYAAGESERAGLGIRFLTLLPWLTPATGMGSAAIAAYAAYQGVTPETFEQGLQPFLTPEQVAKAVLELVTDPGTAVESRLTGAGLQPIG
ncbi:SDR family oxidoreductase [Nocardia sp. IFM 10818]